MVTSSSSSRQQSPRQLDVLLAAFRVGMVFPQALQLDGKALLKLLERLFVFALGAQDTPDRVVDQRRVGMVVPEDLLANLEASLEFLEGSLVVS